MMRKRFLVFGVPALLAFTYGAIQSIEAATELARVNGSVISLEEFNQRYKESLKYYQFKAPTKKGVLDDLIKRELGIQEARKLGLDKDPEVVDRINTVLYHALLEKKLAKEWSAIQISDQEAHDFYAKNPEVRTSTILVALRQDAPPEQVKSAMERMQKIQAELKTGKMSFAEVAQRYSEGPEAPMGGDMDYRNRLQLDPAHYETALRLKTPGKVSEIIRTQRGLQIVKLTAIKPWEDVDKTTVKRIAFDEKRSQIYDRYMNQLKAQAKVSVRGELIKE